MQIYDCIANLHKIREACENYFITESRSDDKLG